MSYSMMTRRWLLSRSWARIPWNVSDITPLERYGGTLNSASSVTLSKACTLTQRHSIADMSSGPVMVRMPRGCFLSCLMHMDASRGEPLLVYTVRDRNSMNSQRMYTMQPRTTSFRLRCSRGDDGPGHSL